MALLDLENATPGGLPQIALTKTVPPSANRLRVERKRLLNLLQDSALQRLVLLKAPAGYGKTTLAVDWCELLRREDSIVAWLSVDEDDNEPSAFAYHISKTLHRAAPSLGQPAIDLLSETKLIASRNVVSAAINAIAESDEEVYLFLDDYHAIKDTRSHDLTAFLLRYAPSNFHLVVMSRTEPPLPISKLRLSDEVTELDATSLRFSLDETEQFLGAELAPRLAAAEISRLHEATEGWPAALQLARISLRNSPDAAKTVAAFSGASRKISAYIEDTLATQADEIVHFLLQTAILGRLESSLCHAVTGIARSAELLQALRHEQFLLVTLDEENGWYRYHHLMRDFLIDRLHAKMADLVPELHRRAHCWFASHQMWNEAVQHAIAAKDFETALGYVEQCAMSLVIKGDLLTLLAWDRQLPRELMRGQTEVKLALAWGMALVTRFAEAGALLDQVEAVAADDRGSEFWRRCRMGRAVWLGLSDDSARGREVAEEALRAGPLDAFNLNSVWNLARFAHWKAGEWDAFYALSAPDASIDEATYVLAENYRLCLYGMAAAHRLQIKAALRHYDEARNLAERHVGARSVSAAMVTGLRALMRYESGDVTNAEISVLDEIDIIDTTVYHESFLSAYLTLARAAMFRNDRGRAFMLLSRAERLAGERGWMRLVAVLLLERVRFLLQDGQTAEVARTLVQLRGIRTRYPAPQRCSWSEIHIAATVAEGIVATASGRLADAIRSLRWAHEELMVTDHRYGALRVGLDLSNALFLAGDRERCFEAFGQVLGWAAEAGAETFLRERQAELAPLYAAAVRQFSTQDPATGFLQKLLKQPAGDTAAVRKAGLTDRERSIVGFIANGQSNKQIARTLGVAPETIKTHVKRIFVKLSAETRAQAVVRAQSLGLLRDIKA